MKIEHKRQSLPPPIYPKQGIDIRCYLNSQYVKMQNRLKIKGIRYPPAPR